MTVIISGYQLSNSQLQYIGLEYSHDGGATWTELFAKPKSEIQTSFYTYTWNVNGYPDGNYQIRAVVTCADNVKNYSLLLPGVIDATLPEVIGSSPSDGILQPGDEISFQLDEMADPATVTIQHCRLIDLGNMKQVPVSVHYNPASMKIIYTISPGQSYFIEDQLLQSQVSGVTDRYGNPLADTVKWNFRVNQGPLHWSPDTYTYTVQTPSVFNSSPVLSNTSPNPVFYSIQKPSDLSTGQLLSAILPAATGQSTFGFTSDTMLPGNPHYDTIFASCLGYPAEKVYITYYTPNFVQFGADSMARHVGGNAGSVQFMILSNLVWSVSENTDWLNTTPSYGHNNDTLFVFFTENTSGAARTATIQVNAEGIPNLQLQLTLHQAVRDTLLLVNKTVGGGTANCFKAGDLLTMQNSTVDSLGVLNLIAGKKIRVLPAFQAKKGSAFHAWISLSDECIPNLPAIAVKENAGSTAGAAEVVAHLPGLFMVYPNPTTGEFTLELQKPDENAEMSVSIYSMQGVRVLSNAYTARKRNTFNLSGYGSGMYVIRVVYGREAGAMKLLKQ